MAKRIYIYLLLIGLILAVFLGTGCVGDFVSDSEGDEEGDSVGEEPFLNQFIEPQVRISFDLNGDGEDEAGEIKKGVGNGVAYVYSEDELIFQSDLEWDVKEIIAGDFNYDGEEDFALSLWKYGNYGEALPFWEEENDDSYKMHLFVYTWENGEVRALWHSSNLPMINLRTRFLDVDGDGRGELVVVERDYEEAKYSVATLQWQDWGFWLVERVKLPVADLF
jgi:hypothetical protein